jgi:hypothetical protein
MGSLLFLLRHAGHSRPKDGVASLAYVPAIHAFSTKADKAWITGSRRFAAAR